MAHRQGTFAVAEVLPRRLLDMEHKLTAILLATLMIAGTACAASGPKISTPFAGVTYELKDGLAIVNGTVQDNDKRIAVKEYLLAREEITRVRSHLFIVPEF